MAVASLVVASSKRSTVTATSQQIEVPMVAKGLYALTSTVACYVAQGADPTADAADANVICPAGGTIVLDGGDGAKAAVKRIGGSDGECTLARVALR